MACASTGMFSACELAAMRATVAATYDQTAAIQRNAPANDGQGGQTESWSTVGTVACSVIPRNGQAKLEGERPVSVTLWTIYLPYGTAITAKDRLVVGSATYEITDLDEGASYATELAVHVRRVA